MSTNRIAALLVTLPGFFAAGHLLYRVWYPDLMGQMAQRVGHVIGR